MLAFRLKLSRQEYSRLKTQLNLSQSRGDFPQVKRILAILALATGNTVSVVAEILKISAQTIRQIIHRYLTGGLTQLESKHSKGRPSKMTKTQKKQLSAWIEAGPEKMGFSGACWRTPMIQWLIHEKFGIDYNTRYISELLKNIGFSYQKAAFVADKRDEELREKWLKEEWPEILRIANAKNAYIVFGDEASFPQWGTLSYTWARQGQQPIVQTAGKRRGFKVFGLIDYFTGKFFAKGHEGKLNAESYIGFLKEVLSKTRKHIILIQDRAPYHRGSKMKAFFEANAHRITVFYLPSYSPDFNPIEKLWKKIKEYGTHLKYFPTFDDLKNTVNEMLIEFQSKSEEILSLFGFYTKLDT